MKVYVADEKGRKSSMKKHAVKLWEDKEINYLLDKAGTSTILNISKKLNRSSKSVLGKLNSLGYTNIRQLNGTLSASFLAKALDVSHSTVIYWIENYGLPATKKNYYRYDTKIKHYSIYPEEFWEWARENKEKINFSKIDPYLILPEPAWVDEERKKDYFKKALKSKKKWTRQEDQKLLMWKKAGLSYREISDRLERSIRSVQSRYLRLKRKEVKSKVN